MTPDQYEIFRNRLTDILHKIRGLEWIKNEFSEILFDGIYKKALENQFRIVLVGGFQSGKSTTFDALCDGRELSPLGHGIKTSACIVSARNLSDENEEERALIKWKESEELLDGFLDLVRPHLKPGLFGKNKAGSLNLDDEKDRSLLLEAVQKEWEIWENNKRNYDVAQKGRLDILRVGSVIMHYHVNKTLNEYRKKKEFRPEDICKKIVFPNSWGQIRSWEDAGKFDIEDVLFAFIRSVDLKLRSRSLRRLGCVFVDCPGLFASRWDTTVARMAMNDADAILYLFDGNKALTDGDLNALIFIRDNGMENNLFYGFNMKRCFKDSNAILEDSLSTLENNGFKIRKNECCLFHSLLYLCSVQAEQLLNNKSYLSSQTLQSKKEAMFNELNNLKVDYNHKCSDSQFVELTYKESRISGLMDKIEKYVINKKGEKVLKGNIQYVSNMLREIIGGLDNIERAAGEERNKFEQEEEKVKEKLDKFEDCKELIEKIYYKNGKNTDEILAQDIWERFEKRKEELHDRISKRLFDEFVGFSRETAEAKMLAIIREEIDLCFGETVNKWIMELKEGNNKIYNDHVNTVIYTINEELKKIWQESGLTEENLMSGLSIEKFSKKIVPDYEKLPSQTNKDEVIKISRLISIKGLLRFAGLYIGTFLSMLLFTIFFAKTILPDLPPTTGISTLIGSFIICILLLWAAQHKIRGGLTRDVGNSLDLTPLFQIIKENTKFRLKEFLRSEILDKHKSAFDKIIEKPRIVFEKRREDYKKDVEQRKAEFEKAKHRKGDILPIKAEIQKLIAEFKKILEGADLTTEAEIQKLTDGVNSCLIKDASTICSNYRCSEK